jgi:hypothetical protein
MKYLVLPRSQQLYFGIALLIVIPVVLGLVFQYQLYDFYLERFVRPDLERDLGFTAGSVQVPGPPGYPAQAAFAVVAVQRDGALDRAGIRPGDLPVGYKHGFATGFYQDLLDVRRGRQAEIWVLARADYEKGMKAWRKVQVSPPSTR